MSNLGQSRERSRREKECAEMRGGKERRCYLNGAGAGFAAVSLERACSSFQFLEVGESACTLSGKTLLWRCRTNGKSITVDCPLGTEGCGQPLGGFVECSLVFSAIGMLVSFPDCISSLPAFVIFSPGVFSQQHTDRIHFFFFGLVLDFNYFVLLELVD